MLRGLLLRSKFGGSQEKKNGEFQGANSEFNGPLPMRRGEKGP